jgi:hypothetical protein
VQRDWHLVDYYAVLGVDTDATQDQITHAFHRLARRLHPDAHPDDPGAEARFKRVTAAYQVLDDPTARAEYDRVRGIGAGSATTGARPQSSAPWAGPPGYDPDDDSLWDDWPPREPPAPAGPVRRGRRVWVRPAWFPDPWMIAVVGLLLVGTAAVVDWQDSRVPDGWVQTTALVTRELPPRPGCFRNCDMDYWIEAPAANGTNGHIYDGPADLGERLPFAYDPEGTRWKVLDQGRNVPWTMGLPGLVLLAAAGLLALFSARRRRFPLRGQGLGPR